MPSDSFQDFKLAGDTKKITMVLKGIIFQYPAQTLLPDKMCLMATLSKTDTWFWLIDCWHSIPYLLYIIMDKMATSSTEATNQRWVIRWCYKCTSTAKKPGPSKQHKVDMCRWLHASYFANVQKSDKVNLISSFLSSCKILRSSDQKVYLQNPSMCVFFMVIAEAVGTWRGKWVVERCYKTTNTVFASLWVENANAVHCPVKTWCGFTFLRTKGYSAVHSIHSPQSQSRNVKCV